MPTQISSRRLLRTILGGALPLLAVVTTAPAQYPAAPKTPATKPAAAAPAPPKNAPINDPTRASARVKAALSARGSALSETVLTGVVVAAGKEGTVMLEVKGGAHYQARPGVPFNISVDGATKQIVVRAITADGVQLEAPATSETVLIPTLGPTGFSGRNGVAQIEYAEFRDLGLRDALRMLADQSGENYSASIEASKVLVNSVLRRVSANTVVEEICKSHNLWFKQDPTTAVTRIMTMEEFERDLVGFREEKTEVFTLMYPNVADIAIAIADLYGDRVQLSLDDEDQYRDSDDLESRFDRFDILSRRGQFNTGTGSNTFVDGYNGAGSFNGSGGSYYGGSTLNYGGSNRGRYGGGYGGYGNNGRNNSYNNNRNYDNRGGPNNQNDDLYRNLTPDQAERLDRALSVHKPGEDGENAVQNLRKKPATIFVTARRRHNMVVVRTSDPTALEEIRTLVRRMDVPTPLVLLEVKVLSVDLGNDFKSVFDYQYSDGHTAGAFTSGDIALPQPGGALVGGVGMRSSDMTFVLVSKNFRARIQLLEEKNRVKSLASPLLLTANNEVSRLFLGEERPLVRNVTSQTIITDNNVATTPNTTIEFRPVGNTLLITPNINSDRTVTLRLLQENSSINQGGATIPIISSNRNGSSSVENVPIDVLASRSVSGTFVAKDDQSVAIGGLIEDNASDKRAQVPVIGRIPVLGFFFRRTEKEKSRKELVVMIRPHIISTPADAEKISRSVLKGLSTPDIKQRLDERLMPDRSPLIQAEPAAIRPVIIDEDDEPLKKPKKRAAPGK